MIEIPFVGMYAETSPSSVSISGRAVIDPPDVAVMPAVGLRPPDEIIGAVRGHGVLRAVRERERDVPRSSLGKKRRRNRKKNFASPDAATW